LACLFFALQSATVQRWLILNVLQHQGAQVVSVDYVHLTSTGLIARNVSFEIEHTNIRFSELVLETPVWELLNGRLILDNGYVRGVRVELPAREVARTPPASTQPIASPLKRFSLPNFKRWGVGSFAWDLVIEDAEGKWCESSGSLRDFHDGYQGLLQIKVRLAQGFAGSGLPALEIAEHLTVVQRVDQPVQLLGRLRAQFIDRADKTLLCEHAVNIVEDGVSFSATLQDNPDAVNPLVSLGGKWHFSDELFEGFPRFYVELQSVPLDLASLFTGEKLPVEGALSWSGELLLTQHGWKLSPEKDLKLSDLTLVLPDGKKLPSAELSGWINAAGTWDHVIDAQLEGRLLNSSSATALMQISLIAKDIDFSSHTELPDGDVKLSLLGNFAELASFAGMPEALRTMGGNLTLIAQTAHYDGLNSDLWFGWTGFTPKPDAAQWSLIAKSQCAWSSSLEWLPSTLSIDLRSPSRATDLSAQISTAMRNEASGWHVQSTSKECYIADILALADALSNALVRSNNPSVVVQESQGSVSGPVWGEVRMDAAINCKKLIYEQYVIENLNSELSVDPLAVTLKAFRSELTGRPVTAEGKLSYQADKFQYVAELNGAVDRIDLAQLTAAPNQKPTIEGTFSAHGTFRGKADNVKILAHQMGGKIKMHSENGFIRPLQGTRAEQTLESLQTRVLGVKTADLVGLVGQMTGNRDIQKVHAATGIGDYFSRVPYNTLDIELSFYPQSHLKIQSFSLLNDELKMTGEGSLTLYPNRSIFEQDLMLELFPFVRGNLLSMFSQGRWLKGSADAQGFTPTRSLQLRGGIRRPLTNLNDWLR
jgi:hypothetical protein